jgi:glutamyl-tRNA synthetase
MAFPTKRRIIAYFTPVISDISTIPIYFSCARYTARATINRGGIRLMSEHVRVRFAPSPTGEPHVGNIRTAIFNWLFARSQGGVFILRIEDTDQKRLVKGVLENLIDALHWLGIDWDEGPDVGGPYGPYIQSERLHHYQDAAKRLLDEGNAYHCFCSPERIEKIRKQQMTHKEQIRYDRHCRDLPKTERSRLQKHGASAVVRFRMPLEGNIVFHDIIRGAVTFDMSLLDDFVLMKSDGFPTYHLANVIDDHLMRITHVMRAEEWLSSAPRHQQLYQALDYPMPKFAHLSVILGSDRSKLSKRHGATSILEYRRMGYLPAAIFNFLALLGWSVDDHTEFIHLTELIKVFSLERMGHSSAIFNQEKLTWLNGVYIRALSPDSLAEQLTPILKDGLQTSITRPIDQHSLLPIIPLIQERLKTLSEAPYLTSFFLTQNLQYDPELLIQKKTNRDICMNALRVSREKLTNIPSWKSPDLEEILRPLAEELQLKTGQLFGIIRVAVTGRKDAPPLFETMQVLGNECCLSRLDAAIEKIRTLPMEF